MKSNYFQEMQQKGIRYKKTHGNNTIVSSNGLFSKAESEAFKYWAIAKEYESSDVFVDSLPEVDLLPEFLQSFRRAGIKCLVVSEEEGSRFDELVVHGCTILGECKVLSRHEAGSPELQIQKGVKVLL